MTAHKFTTGQQVIVATYLGSNPGPVAYTRQVVKNITASGRVRINQTLFDADGVWKTSGSMYWSQIYTIPEWQALQRAKVQR